MFGKLKERLKNWTKKITEEKQEIKEEIPVKSEEKTKEIKTLEEKTKKEKKVIIEKPSKKEEKEEEKEISKEKNKKETLVKEKEIIEEQKEELEPQKKKGFFSKLTSKTIQITEEEFEKYQEDLEFLLLENNVAFEVVEKIVKELKHKITSKEINKKEIESEIKESLKEIIQEILIEPFDIVEEIKNSKEPYVVLFCGINGTGKTTTIAKFASKLKKEKISCVLAGADTFRTAAIEQIKKHGENLGIKVISNEYGSDPSAVGFDAIKYAKAHNIKAVLIDTAGRIHTDKNLMSQIEKITRVCKPNKKIFIGESLTGNDSVEQVKAFDNSVNLDGIILTKADIDEKGGTALSVGYVTKKPILYLGTGQEYEKLEKFDKKKFIERLGL